MAVSAQSCLRRPPPLPSERRPNPERTASDRQRVMRSELELTRQLYELAVDGLSPTGLAVMAIDCEGIGAGPYGLQEVGWSLVQFVPEGGRAQCEVGLITLQGEPGYHWYGALVAPDRPPFAFGQSIELDRGACRDELAGLIARLSASQPLLLVFHAAHGDLLALKALRIPTAHWHTGVADMDLGKTRAGVFVLDTQRLWSGLTGYQDQIGLGHACDVIGVETGGLHNAGNDAKFTLNLFEAMMDRARGGRGA